MGNIETTVDLEKNLTVNTAIGRITAEDILNTAKTYLSQGATRLVLWDFTHADGSAISGDALMRLHEDAKIFIQTTEERRIAIVINRDLGFGLARVAEAYKEISGIKSRYHITRSVEDAMEWLTGDSSPD